MVDGGSLWNFVHVGLCSGALGNLFEKRIEQSFNLQNYEFMIR